MSRKNCRSVLTSGALACALALSTNAVAADIEPALKAAMASPIRTDAERQRDANRLPLQTLQFFQMRDDMRVLELAPGGGWYTKLLAPVLAERGQLYLALGTQGVEAKLLKQPGFEKVNVIPVNADLQRVGRRIEFASLNIDASNIDLVLTFRNLHNFTEKTRGQMNVAAFTALKPGGLYGVVDHTRRHMQADDDENWRRMDPVLMIREIQSAGFELVDFSTLHYRADDELRFEVGRKSVTGNTDRFTLLFRKPG